ncbi:MAG: thermonuclease family protein [Ilumatobacteraceae bacterium]
MNSAIRRTWFSLSLLVLPILGSCAENRTSEVQIGIVADVIDGDTVDLTIAGHSQRVRLIGIDTPETKHPEKPVQCFGPEATRFTASLLAKGTEVRIERDAEARDSYDRLLVYLFRTSDNLFVNLQIVQQGFARVLTIEPNTTYMGEFVTAARDARVNNRGLWNECQG